MSEWVSCEWMDKGMMDGWMGLGGCWMDGGGVTSFIRSPPATTAPGLVPSKESPGTEGINAIPVILIFPPVSGYILLGRVRYQ